MYFFTADEHYNHLKILDYCKRPFKDVNDMNEKLIRNFNSVIGADDITIHAGDFCMSKHWEEANKLIKRLNGEHIFLKGSHDYWMKDSGVYFDQIWEGEIDEIYVVVCHYLMTTWPKSHYGSIQLFGHSHGHIQGNEKQYDIGVDNNRFYPVSFKQIKEKLKL